MTYIRTIACFCLVTALAATVCAQDKSAISGTVTDQQGAMIAEQKIDFRNVDTGLQRVVLTNERGYYHVSGLPAGRYEIKVTRAGLSEFVGRATTTIGQNLSLNITLEVRPIQEQVNIEWTTVVLDSRKTDVSRVVEQHEIENLPINGRNFIDIVRQYSSAVAIGRDIRGGGALTEPDTGIGIVAAPRLSFGGQREYYTSILTDGVDNTQTVTGLTRAVPSAEGIQEFRILNNSFSSEYGRTLGGLVNIITKSGTNSFHGAAYYFVMNDAFKAHSTLKREGADQLRQSQFGFSIGGPFVRNKTFFFANYEGQRFATSNQFAEIIRANLNAINKARQTLNLSPEADNLLRTSDYNQGFGRVDHQLGSRHQLAIRYHITDSTALNFLGSAGRTASASSSARNNFVLDQDVVASTSSLISASLRNEGRFQFARRNFRFPSVRSEPTLEIPNLITMGKSTSDIDFYNETRWQLSDTLSYTKDTHVLKFGVDLNYLNDSVRWEIFFPARAIFPNLNGFLGLAPFTQPTPVAFHWSAPSPNHPPISTSFDRAVPVEWDDSVSYDFTQQYYGFFAQHEWSATRNLTLNAGVRYDFDHFPPNTFKSDLNNFQPRVGLAYKLGESFVARAGFGLYTARRTSWSSIVAGAIIGLRGDHPLASSRGDFFGLDAKLNSYILSGPPLAGPALANLLKNGTFPDTRAAKLIATPIEADNDNPYSEHASLGLSHVIGRDAVISVDYVYVHGLKLQGSRNVNAIQSGVTADGRPLFANRHDPDFLFIQSAPNWGNSIHHGGTISFRNLVSRVLALNAHYTFSKTIDDIGGSHDIGAMPPYIDRRRERAISNQHIGQRFVLSLMSSAPERGLLRNFSFNALFTAESPRYFTVYVGSDTNLDGNPQNDRPAQLGRNTFKGDSYVSLDTRLTRTFKLGEAVRLELIAEGFNLLNTLNIKDFNTVYGAASLVIPPSQILGFGQPREVFDPRHFQFAVKLKF
ncbi:MAG TPA: TonB-dependent receptor [Pyrinomonadaceae bacterium]|nr:TonB-dependent receptor [Pyrinomonadaceae bacterium]